MTNACLKRLCRSKSTVTCEQQSKLTKSIYNQVPLAMHEIEHDCKRFTEDIFVQQQEVQLC